MTIEYNSIPWETYRAEFPITDKYIYMNNAAVSPMSTRVKAAIEEFSEELLNMGTLCEEKLFERVEKVRADAAEFMGAGRDEIAFIKNTTQGVLIAANGIRWRRGDNVVMPSNEFPANVYPWMSLGKRGVELRMVDPAGGRVTARMLADATDDRTRVITVSMVQFSNGYRIDIDKLGDFCRDRGVYLHVDGIQALGCLMCNVKRHKIDFLSAGGHKWLLASPGLGLFYCRKELLDRLDIWNPGWTGVSDPKAFIDYNMTYRDDAGRFEEGCHNFHGIYAMGATLERFREIGMENVEHRILSLTDRLENTLTENDCTVTSPRGNGERSGILCFTRNGTGSSELLEKMSEAGVICSLREGSIRVSPHIYNTEGEIERLAGIIS